MEGSSRWASPAPCSACCRTPSWRTRPPSLAPGDALVLYTDGLTDAYAPGRIVKRAGLVAALESCARRSAAEIAGGLQKALLGAGAGEPRDDIVLLVLRVAERRRERIRDSDKG